MTHPCKFERVCHSQTAFPGGANMKSWNCIKASRPCGSRRAEAKQSPPKIQVDIQPLAFRDRSVSPPNPSTAKRDKDAGAHEQPQAGDASGKVGNPFDQTCCTSHWLCMGGMTRKIRRGNPAITFIMTARRTTSPTLHSCFPSAISFF